MTYIVRCEKCKRIIPISEAAEAITSGYISEDGFEINLEDGYHDVVCMECALSDTTEWKIISSSDKCEFKREDGICMVNPFGANMSNVRICSMDNCKIAVSN